MRRSSLLSVTDADYVLLQVNSHQSSPLFLGGGAPAAALGTAKSGVAAMVLQGGWKDVVSSRRDQPINVYAWNLDETLILLKVLLDGSFAGHFEGLKIHEKGTEIGKHWETIVLELCDEHFFYEEIENYNQPYIGALYEYDDGKDLNMILRLTGLVLLMMMLIKGSLDIGSVLSEISMQRQVVIRARNLRNGVQFIPAKAF